MGGRSSGSIRVLIGLHALGLGLIGLASFPSAFRFHALDLQIYLDTGRELLAGRWPYAKWPMIYPPLSLAFFALPHLAAGVLGFTLDLYRYAALLPLQNMLFSLGVASVLIVLGRAMRPPVPAFLLLYRYTVQALLSGLLLLWYYDIFPALLTLLSVLAIQRGRPGWAGALLGGAIAAKLYAAVWLPILILWHGTMGKWGSALRLLTGAVAGALMPILPFLIIRPQALGEMLAIHWHRGLEIESSPAGWIAALHVLGLAPAGRAFGPGAWEITSPIADQCLRILPMFTALALGGITLTAWAAFQRLPPTSERPLTCLIAPLVAALIAFAAAGKVFSPQYIIWWLPLMPLLPTRFFTLGLALSGLTVLIFPLFFDALLEFRPLAVLLLNLRNLLALGLAALLALWPLTMGKAHRT